MKFSRSSAALATYLAILTTACAPLDSMPDGRPVEGYVASDNPFFSESDLPLGMPPFDRIENRHFPPAFDRGMAEELREALLRRMGRGTTDR